MAWKSPSARKVWIEMYCKRRNILFMTRVTFREEGVDWNRNWIKRRDLRALRHLPRGRCGLKSFENNHLSTPLGHLPRGRCGLKFFLRARNLWLRKSPSARKVWIEIPMHLHTHTRHMCHLPRGRCGLKYDEQNWYKANPSVTFREEGVDWNAE